MPNCGRQIGTLRGTGVNVSNSIDAAMGATTFIPGVGWIISGSYFTASFATELITGKSISEHVQDMVDN